MSVLPQLLAILVCPRCHGELEYRETDPSLVCPACRLRYPIRGDIPIMLVDEATPLEPR
ncbi:MAG: Trm112 family protein [Acidobacteriota bacterium]|nr:Trm112 family protein [Acidobacteriota bacterium]